MKQLTVLLTRPLQQAHYLQQQIESLKGNCILFPTLAILPVPAIAAELATCLVGTDKVIFTSANAVAPVMPYWQQVNDKLEVFAIGPGTAAVLADFGVQSHMPLDEAFSSEGLLALPALQDVAGQRVVIFSGVGGRMTLVEQLLLRQAIVKRIAVYRRSCPKVSLDAHLAQWPRIDVIISTSSESLRNLWSMAGVVGQAWLRQQLLLVVSAKMVELALELGFERRPLVARNASDAGVLRVLLDSFSK